MRTRVLKVLVAFTAALIAVFFLGAYLLPDRIVVERSIEIERPQVQVFAVVNDLSRFNDWSPWYPLDPDAEYRYEGPPAGVGAVMHWQGNEQVRTGSLRITETRPPAQVLTEVEFGGAPEPAISEFRIEALSDERSRISWSFSANMKGPVARWFGLLMPGYIGSDYEKGLSALKQLVEAEPVEDFSDLDVREETMSGYDVIVIAGSAPEGDAEAASAELGTRYGELLAYAERHGLELVGQPLTMTESLESDTWRFLAALPVRSSAVDAREDGIERVRTRTGSALVVEHVGPYRKLAELRRRLDAYARTHGRIRDGAILEIYVSDPGSTPEEQLVTRVIYPVK